MDGKLVRGRNFPPFYAAEDPDFYFEPDVEWSAETQAEAREMPPATELYGPGVAGDPEDRSLNLAGPRCLRIKPGPPHASGDGGRFLPYRQGTVELWMCPRWDSVSLPDNSMVNLLWGPMKARGAAYMFLRYLKQGTGKSLLGWFTTDGKTGPFNYRQYRRSTFLDQGEWVHIAHVWGPRDNFLVYPIRKRKDNVFVHTVYVNGKSGDQNTINSIAWGNRPTAPLEYLSVGYPRESRNIRALVDELRVSDVQRYKRDFEPPSRSRKLRLDEHTRALFHFNGDIAGRSYGTDEPVEAELTR
jgi:hypothetical protein